MIGASGEIRKEQAGGDGTNADLIRELAAMIIEAVNLRHIPIESMTAETTLGPAGLNLDSVDILEIIITLEQNYGIKIQDAEMGKIHLRTLGTIRDFIISQKK